MVHRRHTRIDALSMIWTNESPMIMIAILEERIVQAIDNERWSKWKSWIQFSRECKNQKPHEL